MKFDATYIATFNSTISYWPINCYVKVHFGNVVVGILQILPEFESYFASIFLFYM